MFGARRLACDDEQRGALPVIAIPESQDEWIRTEIHKLTIDRRDLADVLVDIDALERRIVEAIGAEEYAADLLDVRRILARLRLVKALELKGAAPLAKALFDSQVTLGFPTGDERVDSAALFSRICIARGRVDLLKGELEDAIRQLGKEPDPSYVQLVEKIRSLRG